MHAAGLQRSPPLPDFLIPGSTGCKSTRRDGAFNFRLPPLLDFEWVAGQANDRESPRLPAVVINRSRTENGQGVNNLNSVIPAAGRTDASFPAFAISRNWVVSVVLLHLLPAKPSS